MTVQRNGGPASEAISGARPRALEKVRWRRTLANLAASDDSVAPLQSTALSDFFEPPPPIEPEPRYRTPPWLGPPRGTLPGVVALEHVLARTDEVAVCVTRLAAYPAGFELDMVTMSAHEDDELDPLLFGHHRRRDRRSQGEEIPPEMLRLGVQFADGRKATNLGGFHHDPDQLAGPVMNPGGGGGGGGNWHQSLWIWPLPPAGPLVFVCEWPAAGIPLTKYELAAQLVLDASTRARVIFSDEHLPEPPAGGPPISSIG